MKKKETELKEIAKGLNKCFNQALEKELKKKSPNLSKCLTNECYKWFDIIDNLSLKKKQVECLNSLIRVVYQVNLKRIQEIERCY